MDELGYGLGGGGVAGVLTAILAVLVREKIKSETTPAGPAGETLAAIQDLTQRVIRLEVQLEAVRETTDDLRNLNRDLSALLRDLSRKG